MYYTGSSGYMNVFIPLLLPSLVGYKIFLSINKKKKFNIESKITYYLIFVLFSNFFSVVTSILFFHLKINLETRLYKYPTFSIKYIAISLIINFVLAFVFSFIREISVDVEIKKTKKLKKKKGKKNEKNVK